MTNDIAALVAELGTAARNMERALRSRMAGVNSLEARLMLQAAEALQSLQAERDEAVTKVVEWVAAGWDVRADAAETALTAAQETIRRQSEALERYGKHDGLCAIVGGYGYCTCGYDDARAALEPAGGER